MSDVSVCVCQLGARLHYGAARALEAKSALRELRTDICAVTGWPMLLSAIPRRMRPPALERLLGRVPAGIPAEKVRTFSRMGLAYQWRLSRARTEGERIQAHLRAGEQFGALVSKAGFASATHVYAFSSAALELLDAARQSGLRTVVELPSAACEFERRIVDEERSRYPGWEPDPGSGDGDRDDQKAAFAARQRLEWEKADSIVVPSRFVAGSVGACLGPVDRCVVVPYGVGGACWQAGSQAGSQAHRRPHHGPLRVLTVGNVNLQKGAQYTCEAARRLGRRVEFRLVGKFMLSESRRNRFSGNLSLAGSIPRSQVSLQFEWADVFLLPTLCDGMATVLLEALAAGLPVISTENSGLAIRDGEEGFVVPIRDPDAIAEKLDSLQSDPSLLARMSQRARERAACFTLEAYGERLYRAIAAGPAVSG